MAKDSWPQTIKKIEDPEKAKQLSFKKQKLQNWLNGLNLNIRFHNQFDKIPTKFRKDYNKYLICYVADNQKMEVILSQAEELGYVCEKGPKYNSYHNKPKDYITQQNDSEQFSFRIDLESVKL